MINSPVVHELTQFGRYGSFDDLKMIAINNILLYIIL